MSRIVAARPCPRELRAMPRLTLDPPHLVEELYGQVFFLLEGSTKGGIMPESLPVRPAHVLQANCRGVPDASSFYLFLVFILLPLVLPH